MGLNIYTHNRLCYCDTTNNAQFFFLTISSLVQRKWSFCVLPLILLECRCVSGSFPATWGEETGNAERMTLASQHGWVDCGGDIRREEKMPLNVFFFLFVCVRAVKHPGQSGYYFNEGCGWINTPLHCGVQQPNQWCQAEHKSIFNRPDCFLFFFLNYEDDRLVVVISGRKMC